MKRAKHIVVWILLASMLLSLTACGTDSSTKKSETTEKEEAEKEETEVEEAAEVKIAALKGPTALGMLQMMHDSEEDSEEASVEEQDSGETAKERQDSYEFTLAGSADEILGRIIQGEFDIAAVPTNVAATLYNKTQGAVKLAAVNTLGVLYVVETGDTVDSVSDLKGKTIYSLGQGSTPQYALEYILRQNGLDPQNDVTITYCKEATEVASLMATGTAEIAVLPQPFVTSLIAQNESVRIALDVTEEWNKVGDGSTLTMGCIVVQEAFLEEHPKAFACFMQRYEESVKFTNGDDTLEEAAQYAEDFGIIAKKEIAKKAIPECNIVFLTGDEMKTVAGGFLSVMYDADPTSVGGTLPDDAFYYGTEE